MSLCAIVLAKNEAKNLTDCLDSVGFADEVLVVDDFSTDETVSIARAKGARVKQRQLENFASQRNFALSKTRADWVFFVDADETVPRALAEEILKVTSQEVSAGSEIVAYKIPRRNHIFGKVITHTGWAPDERIILFQRTKGRFEGAVHEVAAVTGPTGSLKSALEHFNYSDLDQFLAKASRYTQIAAAGLIDSGYQFYWQDLIIEPAEEFFRRYFAWQGYRDGLHGLVLSLLQAWVTLLVYLRVWQNGRFAEAAIPFADLEKSLGQKASDWSWWSAKIKKGQKGYLAKIIDLCRRLFR